MQTMFKVCKLYLLLCLGLSINASPILSGLKTTSSDYQQSDSSHHESQFSSNSDFGNMETKFSLQSGTAVDQSLISTPGITTTYRDQNGNLVTQVKKETYNKENGQSAHAFEIQESKQLPNGYSKSFKKEYSSSNVVGSQPTTFYQKPLNAEKYYNSEQISNGESSSYGHSFQNYQGQSIPANIGNTGVQSNFKSTVDQSLTNIPGVTTTFRDQNGNIVTQVKKEIVTNNDGQKGHVVEFEETKQLPNGYSKSFKKEYSSSSVVGSQPTTFFQKPLNAEKYYNSEQISNGQTFQNYQGQSIPANIGNIGVQSNYKSTVDQSLTNIPGVTSTFRDQNGNIVTQVKKEIVTNNDGKNGHVVEYEETKQLPNGYSKSFKKEYSSSSVAGSQPTTFFQKPSNAEKYYNSEQISNGQTFQNYQGQSIPANIGNIGVQSNFKSTVDQSLTNIPGVTSTFRDQNGNIVTQVKKEIVTNNDGKNGHVVEYEETKQFPNGYSKSFKKEYSSSSVIGAHPAFIKNTTSEKSTYLPQKFTQADTEKFNGYNTFFNNQKYTLEPDSPISSQVFKNKKQTEIASPLKGNSFGHNTKDQINCDERCSTSLTNQAFTQTLNSNLSPVGMDLISTQKPPIRQKFEKIESFSTQTQEESGQQSVDLHGYSIPSQIGQQSVDISNQYTPKKPSSPNYEKIESFSTQTQEEVGQQSVDLHGYSKPSQIGQQSVDISNQYTPKKPSSQKFEKIESFSTQAQEEVGQQSVDLHGYSRPSQIGQQSVDISNQYTTKKPSSQKFEKIESFSTQPKEEVGQQSVDLHGYSRPSQIGQQSVDISNQYIPKKPSSQKFEKIESFSTQTQEEIGQQSVDLHGYSKPSQIGQQSVDISNQYTPKKPSSQKFEKIESFSTQTQEEVGQQSVDLHGYSKPSQIGQQSVDISNQYTTKKPSSQKFEKIESFSTQTQEEIGQQSVDLHGYSKPSQIGQQSVDISNQYTPKKPSSQKFEKIESFSTQTQEEVGQQSVDLHGYLRPSQIGQQSVDISNQYTPKKPSSQKFEKIESFSTQTQEEVGQQSVDLHGYSRPSQIGQQSVDISNQYTTKKPSSQKFEKIESFSTQPQEEVGQQSVDLHGYSRPSQIGQQSVDISNQNTPKKPSSQKFEKIVSFSTQTQEEVGQQSVDLHGYSKPSQIGQQSVDISNQYTPKKPSSQNYEKIESFSTQTQEEVGQQSVDLHGYSKPSQIGQQSVDISNQYTPKKPSSQKFEKIESFSTQTQEEVGQQPVDLYGYSKPSQIGQQSVDIGNIYSQNKPTGQLFEKIESSYQNKHNFIGQQPVNINVNDKSSQQYGTGQQIFSQPIAGQQIQGSEFFKSNYGGTTQLLDLGIVGQQPTEYIRAPGQQNMNNNKYIGQQSMGVFESQSTIEKNINLGSVDQLHTDVDGYQRNVHPNYQTYHDQSMKNPVFQGQQTVDYTSDFDGHKPINQKQYGNIDFQSSKLSSQTGQFSTGNNELITSKYNSVFDKLGQLEHEILGAKSTVNINKGNVQTAYSTNHNVKSMPVQTSQLESHFSKTINENTQYIEPESETVYSKSLKKDSKLVVQQDTIENQTSNNDYFSENPTTASSVWRKIGDKFKGTFENAKNKAQQLASNINDKVGFSSITGNPC